MYTNYRLITYIASHLFEWITWLAVEAENVILYGFHCRDTETISRDLTTLVSVCFSHATFKACKQKQEFSQPTYANITKKSIHQASICQHYENNLSIKVTSEMTSHAHTFSLSPEMGDLLNQVAWVYPWHPSAIAGYSAPPVTELRDPIPPWVFGATAVLSRFLCWWAMFFCCGADWSK